MRCFALRITLPAPVKTIRTRTMHCPAPAAPCGEAIIKQRRLSLNLPVQDFTVIITGLPLCSPKRSWQSDSQPNILGGRLGIKPLQTDTKVKNSASDPFLLSPSISEP